MNKIKVKKRLNRISVFALGVLWAVFFMVVGQSTLLWEHDLEEILEISLYFLGIFGFFVFILGFVVRRLPFS